MDSKPWLNQDCFHTVTLKMPQKQVQPCSTTMLTNTWRKWLKHVSPTQIHHGLLVLKWEISTLFQYHTVKGIARSEEHTSELQSRFDLVCRLLLEKKK